MFPGPLSGVGVEAVDPKITILIPNGSVVTPHPYCKARAVVRSRVKSGQVPAGASDTVDISPVRVQNAA
jgi:hypothetical protein